MKSHRNRNRSKSRRRYRVKSRRNKRSRRRRVKSRKSRSVKSRGRKSRGRKSRGRKSRSVKTGKKRKRTSRKIGRSLYIQKGGTLEATGIGGGGYSGGWYGNVNTINEFLKLNAGIILVKGGGDKMTNLKARKEILIADFTNYYRLSVYKLIDKINKYLEDEGVVREIGCPCHVVVSGGDGFNSNLYANQRVISPDIDVKVIMRLDHLGVNPYPCKKPDQKKKDKWIRGNAHLWTNMYKKLVYHVEKIVDCIVDKLNGGTASETCSLSEEFVTGVRGFFYNPQSDQLRYGDFNKRSGGSSLQNHMATGDATYMTNEFFKKLDVEAAVGTGTDDNAGYAWARRTNDMEAGGKAPPYTLNNVKLISIDLRYNKGDYYGSLAGVLDIVIGVPGHIGWDYMCEECMYLPTFGDAEDGGRVKAGGVSFPRLHDVAIEGKWNSHGEINALHVYFITLDYYTYECFKMIKLGLRTKNGKIIKDLNRYYTLRVTGALCDTNTKLEEVLCSVKVCQEQFPEYYGRGGDLFVQILDITTKIWQIDHRVPRVKDLDYTKIDGLEMTPVANPGGGGLTNISLTGGACSECGFKSVGCDGSVDYRCMCSGYVKRLSQSEKDAVVILSGMFATQHIVESPEIERELWIMDQSYRETRIKTAAGDAAAAPNDEERAAHTLVRMKNCHFNNDDYDLVDEEEEKKEIERRIIDRLWEGDDYHPEQLSMEQLNNYLDDCDGSGDGLQYGERHRGGSVMKGGGYEDGNQGINTPSIGKILKMLNIYDVCKYCMTSGFLKNDAMEIYVLFNTVLNINAKVPEGLEPSIPLHPPPPEWKRFNYEKLMVGEKKDDILVRPPKDCYGKMGDKFTTNSVFGKSINNFILLFTFLNKCVSDKSNGGKLVCLMAQFKYHGESGDKVQKDSKTAAQYIFSSLIQGLNRNKILSKMKSVKKKTVLPVPDPPTMELLKLIESFYKAIGTRGE